MLFFVSILFFLFHSTHIYVCWLVSIYIYYCLHYILIPFSAIAKCMVFVTNARFFRGWAYDRSFFSFAPLCCYLLFIFGAALFHFFSLFLLSVSTPFWDACFSFCQCVRLNKLPKVYYVLLLQFGILLLSFVAPVCIALFFLKFTFANQSWFLIDFNGFPHASIASLLLSSSFFDFSFLFPLFHCNAINK